MVDYRHRFSASAVAQAKNVPRPSADHSTSRLFAWQPSAPLQSIYERALCVPPERRLAIVQRWYRLTSCWRLSVWFFFFLKKIRESAIENLSAEPKRPKGPPFVMVDKPMDGRFVCLEDDAVLDSIAVFCWRERWQAACL